MQPTYEFIGASANRIYYSLDRLRTSQEFRDIENSIASKVDRVVVVMIDNIVPYKTFPGGVRTQEVTGELNRTQYIYIETSTTSVKQEDGVWKSMSVEQVFVHALSHGASDLPKTPTIGNTNTYPQSMIRPGIRKRPWNSTKASPSPKQTTTPTTPAR